eukprot:scaffold42929_cov69-Phaeocystis_antarctica.AAC.5
MSLHHAAMSGAPFDVMKLLLDANPDAVTTADEARSSVHAAPPTPRLAQFLSPRAIAPPKPKLHRTLRHTQEEELPLHYAAAKGAPFEVMKLLNDADPKATVSKGKVRAVEPTHYAQDGATVCSSAWVAVPVAAFPLRGCPGHDPGTALRAG